MKKFLKWFLISTGIVIILGVIFVVFFLKIVLVNKLSRELDNTFKDYYTLHYESLNTSIDWNGLSISIQNPHFKSDTSKHELNKRFPTLFFNSSRLELKNISIKKLLFTDNLKLDEIKLSKPELKFIIFDLDNALSEKPIVYKLKKRINTFIDIGRIDIENGNIACSNFNNLTDTTFLGFNINSSVEKIQIRPSQLKTLAYSLGKKNNFILSVDKAFYKPYKSDYFFYMDSLLLNDREKNISGKNISATTLKSKMDISKALAFSRTIAETTMGSFIINGYELKELVLQNAIVLHSLKLDRIDLDMFKNKKKAIDKEREKLLIQEMLTSLPFTLKIDSVSISNSKLYFEVIDHFTKSPASIHLTNMNILFTKVNTIKGSQDTLLMQGSGKLMNVAKFNIQIIFPNIFLDENYYTAYIGPMSFKSFNPILSSYSGIKIIDGTINSISFSGKCRKYDNRGSLVFKYNDLKIESEKMGRNGKMKKALLISKLGNFILQKNNPMNSEDKATTFTYYFKREKYQSHLLLLFGGMLEGVKNTLLDKSIQDKIKKFNLINRMKHK